MKYYLIAFFSLLSSVAYTQVTTTIKWQANKVPDIHDTIYYATDRKLKWKDFQGRPDTKSIAAAITVSGFGYMLAMKSKNGKTAVAITVYCFYNKAISWVKPGMQSDYALLHEQHHFDITYIGACLFINKLRAAAFTLSNYAELVESINNECNAEMEKMQNDYDGQTKNGQVENIQAGWNKKIDELLAALITD